MTASSDTRGRRDLADIVTGVVRGPRTHAATGSEGLAVLTRITVLVIGTVLKAVPVSQRPQLRRDIVEQIRQIVERETAALLDDEDDEDDDTAKRRNES